MSTGVKLYTLVRFAKFIERVGQGSLSMRSFVFLRETRISSQNAAMRRDLKRLYPQSEVVSLDPAMQQSISRLKNISANDLFVYIQGERGTDKELVARLCHKHSERNCGPLVFADLPMYEAGELSGLLFGSKNKAQGTGGGLLQAAHGGTLVVSQHQ